MQIPPEAIEKAIEGGWRPFCPPKYWKRIESNKEVVEFKADDYDVPAYEIPSAAIALDPAFWKALGKALRWTEIGFDKGLPSWFVRAQEHNALILTGGDTEKFWAELLI